MKWLLECQAGLQSLQVAFGCGLQRHDKRRTQSQPQSLPSRFLLHHGLQIRSKQDQDNSKNVTSISGSLVPRMARVRLKPPIAEQPEPGSCLSWVCAKPRKGSPVAAAPVAPSRERNERRLNRPHEGVSSDSVFALDFRFSVDIEFLRK